MPAAAVSSVASRRTPGEAAPVIFEAGSTVAAIPPIAADEVMERLDGRGVAPSIADPHLYKDTYRTVDAVLRHEPPRDGREPRVSGHEQDCGADGAPSRGPLELEAPPVEPPKPRRGRIGRGAAEILKSRYGVKSVRYWI